MIIIEKNKDYPYGGMRPFVTVCKRRQSAITHFRTRPEVNARW